MVCCAVHHMMLSEVQCPQKNLLENYFSAAVKTNF